MLWKVLVSNSLAWRVSKISNVLLMDNKNIFFFFLNETEQTKKSWAKVNGPISCLFSGSCFYFGCLLEAVVIFFSFTAHCYSTSIHSLAECSVLVPVSLNPPSWTAQCALTGQLLHARAGTYPLLCFRQNRHNRRNRTWKSHFLHYGGFEKRI